MSNVSGTFATGANSGGDGDQVSEALVIDSTTSRMLITTWGEISTVNKIRLQKSLDNGETWSNISILNSVVTNQSQAVLPGEQWRVSLLAAVPRKTVAYELTLES